MTRNQQRPTSLENALRVLKFFSMDEPEISVTSLALKLDTSKSTAHRLLSSLAQEGFVFKDPHTNLYSLGSSVLSLVNIVNTQIHISTEAVPILNMLVETIKVNAHLAIMEGLDVVYLQTIDSNYLAEDYVHLGNRKPAFCTSAGQSILAFQPETANEAVDNLIKYTPNTIIRPDLFLQRLQLIREQGYALCQEEYRPQITGIGVPVFDEFGEVNASLSITANSKRVSSIRLQKRYASLLQTAAGKLTEIIKLRKGSEFT